MDTLASLIRRAREAAGLTQQQVADAFKINRVNVSTWEKGDTRPSVDKLPMLENLLGTPKGYFESASDFNQVDVSRRRSRGQPVHIIPGDQLLAPGKMPVFAAAKGGDGHVIVTFDPVDYVKMPAELENVKGGYGLLIAGDSMIPAFWPGDTALVNPNLQPQRMRNVILYHTPPAGGEAEAIVKQLNSWNDREWHLQQYNPLLEFTEYRREWPICHRVVGKYDWR